MNPKIQDLQTMITSAKNLIAEEQKKCPHKNVKTKTGSNTGNYDPSSDCYWVDVECHDCGKFMHYSDHTEEYHHYTGIKYK